MLEVIDYHAPVLLSWSWAWCKNDEQFSNTWATNASLRGLLSGCRVSLNVDDDELGTFGNIHIHTIKPLHISLAWSPQSVCLQQEAQEAALWANRPLNDNKCCFYFCLCVKMMCSTNLWGLCVWLQGPTAAPGKDSEVCVSRGERRNWKLPQQQGKKQNYFIFSFLFFLLLKNIYIYLNLWH